jgi:hypothetical protein
MREKAATRNAIEALDMIKKGIDLLGNTRLLCEKLARQLGFLGVDNNTTYERVENSTMTSEHIPPLQYNLSEGHINRAALTLRPNVNQVNSFRVKLYINLYLYIYTYDLTKIKYNVGHHCLHRI